MLISIITVTYNCENEICKTLISIAEQIFEDYELLIIDGNSSDKTLELANQFKNKIPNMRIYSESDMGIYDAMNKGVALAKGKYLYFLNAGDFFLENDLLQRVAKWCIGEKDIYYGSVLKDNKIECYPKYIRTSWLTLMERMVCHQAIFAKKYLYLKNPYNLEYKICADRDWLIRVLKQNVSVEKMDDLVICSYDLDGVSSNYEKFSQESLKIARKYMGFLGPLVVCLKRFVGKIK